MPVKFRCMYCGQLLGIARRKAGTVVSCPKCDRSVTVPSETPPDAEPGKGKPVSAPVFEAEGFGAWIEGSPSGSASGDGGGPAVARRPGTESAPPPSPMGRLAGGAVRQAPPPAGQPNSAEPVIWLDSETGRVVMITVVLMVAAFAIGVAVGRFSLSRASSSPGRPTPAAAHAVDPVAAPPQAGDQPAANDRPAAGDNRLFGVIRYQSEGNKATVDVGAAVLVVPDPKSWSGARPVAEGLRLGDGDLAAAAGLRRLQEIGGDRVYCNRDGEYSVQVSAPGDYFVLVVSANRPRRNAEDVKDLTDFSKLFDDYRNIVGDREYLLQRRRFASGQPQELNWTFDAAPIVSVP